MFVVDEIHVVDVVDVLRVVDGEDCERFGWLGRSTNENLNVVPERIYKRMERLLSFHFSQQVLVVYICASQANPYRNGLVLWDFSAYQPVFTSKLS